MSKREAICSSCKELKPASEYFADNQRRSGLTRRCKECNRIYLRKWNKTAKGKENHRKSQARFIKSNPERNAIYRQAQTVALGEACVRCNRDDVRLIRHHPDYLKPKDIVTLCDQCHRTVHKELSNA